MWLMGDRFLILTVPLVFILVVIMAPWPQLSVEYFAVRIPPLLTVSVGLAVFVAEHLPAIYKFLKLPETDQPNHSGAEAFQQAPFSHLKEHELCCMAGPPSRNASSHTSDPSLSERGVVRSEWNSEIRQFFVTSGSGHANDTIASIPSHSMDHFIHGNEKKDRLPPQ
ncbi:uncharacterized protein BCR38DRAFT_175211 [Pseudomassariella vexata]|uniref:Uncharacterized protein n=1 Tax=Pseudomassariella vexata TaxID=1141098 RepID=A0A1Y2E3W1_9PEZI|nr:uncharacterized protein BCR38DRAFT_175211 [Pseudomassariella vexata]ORY66212.1 hypothetical protein BCR38DRAFT_175211 [Pseudomassariella vexata]